MAKLIIINFSVPERFTPVLEEFESLLDKDPEFSKVLANMSSRYNKKRKLNKLRSAKFRFVIAKYIKERKINILKNKNA